MTAHVCTSTCRYDNCAVRRAAVAASVEAQLAASARRRDRARREQLPLDLETVTAPSGRRRT